MSPSRGPDAAKRRARRTDPLTAEEETEREWLLTVHGPSWQRDVEEAERHLDVLYAGRRQVMLRMEQLGVPHRQIGAVFGGVNESAVSQQLRKAHAEAAQRETAGPGA